MEIVEITQSDDLSSVARKCAINFRQLARYVEQSVRKQGRINVDDIMQVVTALADEVAEIESTTIPNEVSAQIAAQDIPGKISDQIDALDVPGMVDDAVEAAMVPSVGSYEISDSMPSYAGTSWEQVGAIELTGGESAPVWQRTS